jgi:PAS domain S-box-containing protein
VPNSPRSPREPDGLEALESWIRAEDEVTDVLASARGLADAASGISRGLGGRLGCDAAVLWAGDAAEGTLECRHVWKREAGSRTPYEGAPQPLRLSPGVGLAGRAFASRRPAWVQDAPGAESEDAPGSVPAARAVLAVPVVYGETLFGVIELFRREPIPAGDGARVAAGRLGKQIGQFTAREDAFRDSVRSRRELTDLFENAPVGVHLLDREGRVVRVNRAELEILGYARDEVVGRPWRDLHVDPRVADDLLHALSAGDPRETVRTFDARLRCKDGSVKWVRVDANVLRDDGGGGHVRAFLRDVTAHKEAELALRASEHRYRRLVEGARDYALHALDPEGRVSSWGEGARRLYGHEAAEVLARDFSLTFTPEDVADEVPSRMLRLATDEGEFRHEGWRVRKDGSRFWAEVVYTALRDPAGRLEAVSVLTRDATQRRRLDVLRQRSADLEVANRSVIEAGRRNAAILRSAAEAVEGPTAEVEAAAQRLRARGGRPAAGDDPDLDALLAALARLRRAIEGLEETVAAAPEEAPDAEAEEVDLVRLAGEARDLLREPAAERRLRVEVDVDPAVASVRMAPERLRQVLFNLLSNGIRSSRERARVSLRVLPEGESHFRVEVEDAGIGIPPDELDRVFLPRDEPASGERPAAGPGLGLPATKRIVERHGGRVGVHSTLGRGSVLFAVLPRAPLRPSESEPVPSGAGTETAPVLVVSPNPATRASVGWTLGHAGHEPVAAAGVEEGLALAGDRRFDAVAVDLALEGADPVEFVASLRSEGASRDVSTVIAVLGTAEAGAAALVVSDVLPRPAPADRLFAALERARVPRGRRGTVVVVDGDVRLLEATSRALDLLGYRAVVEPDGHAGLRACAEEGPAAVVLSPFLSGMDPFTFLAHLRQLTGAVGVPVLLTLPRPLTEEQLGALRAGATAAGDRQWPRLLRRAGVAPPG